MLAPPLVWPHRHDRGLPEHGEPGLGARIPITVPAVMFLIALFVMPETRKHSIWEEGAIEAARART